MKECYLYQKIGTRSVKCLACSHFCHISDGGAGICGVRHNLEGVLYSLVYGRAVAVNVDPIEKKPLYHFLPHSYSFSVGTFGCNFACVNCQNYEISQMCGHKGRIEDYDKLYFGYEFSPEDIVKEARQYKCSSISFTYNEPTIFLEYALDTMQEAKRADLANVWVSNGYMSARTLDLIIPYLDAINIDLKSYSDDFYKKNTGGRLQPVLDNCVRLKQEGVWLEVTTLIIPGLTDNENMLKELARFIKEKLGKNTPWHISSFSGAVSWKLQNTPDTPIETLKRIEKIGKEEGLENVYLGNV